MLRGDNSASTSTEPASMSYLGMNEDRVGVSRATRSLVGKNRRRRRKGDDEEGVDYSCESFIFSGSLPPLPHYNHHLYRTRPRTSLSLLLLLSVIILSTATTSKASPLFHDEDMLLRPELMRQYEGGQVPETNGDGGGGGGGGGGFSLPLYQQSNHLTRRTDSDALRSWALREKDRIRTKYGGSGAENDNAEEGGGSTRERKREKRQTKTGTSTTTLASSSSKPTSTSSGTLSGTTLGSGNTNTTRNTTTVGQVQVMNFEADLVYFAPVGIGAPPQYMNVILDTGSADLWIAATNCTAFSGCIDIPIYNTSISRSANEQNTTFSVKYGAGSATGDLWEDYVGFAGYNVSSQGFALVDTVSNDLLSGNISGLMGLGWEPLAASGVMPFWQNLFQAGVLPFPGFAFHLTRFVNVTTASRVEPGGLLTFGYLNSSLYEGDINYVNIPSGLESYWVIPMDSLAVNQTNVTSLGKGPMTAIDTGTTLIGGPPEVIQQLYGLIPGALAATGDYTGYYSYPCDSKVNVTFGFGGLVYNMSFDDFNLGPFGRTADNVSTCLGAFFDLSLSTNSKISWVVGAAFLKNVFSVYRGLPASVGFARLASGSNSTAGATIGTGNGTSYSNFTNLPPGIFGPSGVTSLKTSTSTGSGTLEPTIMPEQVTTAIQAGQTLSKSPVPVNGNAASRGWRPTPLQLDWTLAGVLATSLALCVGAGILVV